MKIKRISLLFITLFTCSFVNAQIVQLLNENFNSGFPTGWTRHNYDGLTPAGPVAFVTNAWVPYEDDDSTGTGDSVLIATSYYTPAGTANDWLITPAITLEGNGNFLTWEVKSMDPSYPDGYTVYISNSLPTVDSFAVNTPLYATDGEFPEWTERSVSLDSFVNQTVFIAFRARSTDKFLLLLDNIHVYADTLTSVSENNSVEETKTTVFPNPVKSVLNVHSTATLQTCTISDLSGKIQLSRMDVNALHTTLNLEQLPAGIYILTAVSTNGIESRSKIIKPE